MTFCERLSELVRACFTALWVTSGEQADAVRELRQLCHDEQWRLAIWDIESGLTLAGSGPAEQATDPLAAVRALAALGAESIAGDGCETTVLVLRNFHRFLGSAEIVQALDHQIQRGKQHRTIIVILAPVTDIPIELEKAFVVVEHALPDRSALLEIAQGMATEQGDLPEGDGLERVLQAAGGLTRSEAENAFSLSLVRTRRIEAECIWELKTGQLQKSGLLQLYRGSARFAELGGLEALKHFCRRSLVGPSNAETGPSESPAVSPSTSARPRGVLLLSPPGCGKSQFCKALGHETGRPVLMLDVGALLGSLVGQSEQRTRQALAIADAMAPCVLMIDEVEKAFAGSGGGAGDSGVASRVFGTVLTWLNDHTSDVYVVCTSNDVSRLPGEFARAERFDGVFFVDLPSRAEKDGIWDLYLSAFGQDPEQSRPADDQWTGAEIKSCCRLAALLNVPLIEAAGNVVPVAVTASEAVARLRTWAGGRCLDAHQGGLYQAVAPGESASRARRRRRVDRGPSLN